MKSIVIVQHSVPTLTNNIREFYLIKGLSKRNKVTLLTILSSGYNYKDLLKIKKFCKVIIAPQYVKGLFKQKLYNFINNTKSTYLKYNKHFPFKSKIISEHYYPIFWLKKKLKKLLSIRNFDYIQVEHSYLGHVLNDVKTKSTKILDFHNIHSYMKNNSDEKRLIMKDEKKLIDIYDIAICCSEIDKKRLEQLNYKNILVLPNMVDTNYFKSSFKFAKKSLSLLFIGQMNYKPNFDGIKYFFKKIHPLLNSNTTINIIGHYDSSMFAKESKLKNVTFYGFIEEIRSYFQNAIFICPLLDGGGTRIKILTAFAAGAPVVSTSKGAEGIECTNGKDILIADAPEAFAQNIKTLINDKKLYFKIKNNARKLVESKYAWKKIVKDYNKYLNNLKNSN